MNGPGNVRVSGPGGRGSPGVRVHVATRGGSPSVLPRQETQAPVIPTARWTPQAPAPAARIASPTRGLVPGQLNVGVERCPTSLGQVSAPCAPCQPVLPPVGPGPPIIGTFNLWGVLYYNGSEVVNTPGAPTDGGLYFLGGHVGEPGGPPLWHDLLREEHFWEAPQQFAPTEPGRKETIWIMGPDGVLRPGPSPTNPGDTLLFNGTTIEWGPAAVGEKVLIHHQTVPVFEFTLPHDFGRLPVVSVLDGTGRQMLAQVIPTEDEVAFAFGVITTFTAILK